MSAPKWLRWLLAPALLLGAGALIWGNWPRDSAVRVGIDDALRDYRAGSESRAPTLAGLPAPGVYVYSIAGGETLAGVLDGSHRYSGATTVTVMPSSCGVTELWQPLAERWAEARFCAGEEEFHLAGMSERHEFFGRSMLDSYRCRGTTPALASARVGLGWRSVCSGESGALRISSRVMAIGAVEVDGRQLAAVRIRSRAVAEGDSVGVSIQSEWRRRSDGLLLRRTVTTQASVEILGGGTYGESYSLELLEVDPRR